MLKKQAKTLPHQYLPVIKHFIARPRLLIASVIGFALWLMMPQDWRYTTRILIAWNLSVGLYLILVALMMLRSDTKKIRTRAAQQDEGGILILSLTMITALASLAAIIAELATAKTVGGQAELRHIALAAMTVIFSWTFMQTMFALHYAHEYYSDEKDESSYGLEFPGNNTNPDYWDFIYFAFIIGTAAQTADINITSRIIRRTVAIHCLMVFFFNTTILALTVNIGASLF